MASSLSFDCRVRNEMPRDSAASAREGKRRSASAILMRSTALVARSTAWVSVPDRSIESPSDEPAAAEEMCRSGPVIVLRSHRMAARSMQFSSSRMFPGQWYERSSARASSAIRSCGLASSREKR